MSPPNPICIAKKYDMEKLFSNITFVGGIHGVGKSTICKKICTDLNIQYLSASEVLNWAELNEDGKNKKVQDISVTQDRLVNGLFKRVNKNHFYLLEGHYCLFDKSGNIVKIPFETFQAINPISLYVIVDNVDEIKSRLESRDQRPYDLSLLKEMQDQEISYAQELSRKLNVNLSIVEGGNYSDILSTFKFK